ncbi:DUF3293 domain-containing protein [Leucothrix pacifica]|uniref:DUF3293 domain-containing protein n=1 Tax=Leucothrix pacifica TaxID=1247513 RepID=A0A317CAM0_9GAMM|nr:DUF3293 domain-containing protein [Leucothrix pacifica]PWQ95588.1 hypothetical protein DKW60_14310 [Leucothrix pacifica]
MKKKYISRETEAAYRNTNYVVPMPDKNTVLHVGVASDEIRQLLTDAGASGVVFMTAHNPFGVFLDEAENTAANHLLQKDLEARFETVMNCYGASPCEEYREDSLLAFPVSHSQAIELCCQYEQNAVLFIDAKGVPELVFHPDIQTNHPEV